MAANYWLLTMNGLLIIDKPAGMTSHDVVARARRILQQRSVGHLGTLDPMATGVLPIVAGNFTRLQQFFLHADKEYEGEIRFGFATDTYDAEGEPATAPQQINLKLEDLRKLSQTFVGDVDQAPPPFSAKKIGGVPAYKLARKGHDPELKKVQVKVECFEILSLDQGSARFHAHVSSGTYIRSLAHDLGQRAGTGAHLASLRRTRVGDFRIEDARTLEQFAAAPAAAFIHPRTLLADMPAVTATEQMVAFIRNGRAVNLPEMSRAKYVKVFLGQTELIAIATRIAGTLFHAKVVLAGN
jgi:tRNA pseudouridine55 synthase